MGKDQELLEAARNGNVVVVEKLLSSKAKRGGPLARYLLVLFFTPSSHRTVELLLDFLFLKKSYLSVRFNLLTQIELLPHPFVLTA